HRGRMDVQHPPESLGDEPLDLLSEALECCAPLDLEMHLDRQRFAFAAEPHAVMAVQLALDQARHARHLARRVGGIAGDDVIRDARMALHRNDSRPGPIAPGKNACGNKFTLLARLPCPRAPWPR